MGLGGNVSNSPSGVSELVPQVPAAAGPMLEAKLMNLIKGRLQKFWLRNNFSVKFTRSRAPAALPDQPWYASDATVHALGKKWMVASEGQTLAVGMGLRNSSHFWNSSLRWCTLLIIPACITPPTVMRCLLNWVMAKAVTRRGGTWLHSSQDGFPVFLCSYWHNTVWHFIDCSSENNAKCRICTTFGCSFLVENCWWNVKFQLHRTDRNSSDVGLLQTNEEYYS